MHSMVIRASEPRRSASSSCVEPKISWKSLVRNLPSLRAADAALFTVSAAEGVDGLTQMLWDECAAVGTPRAVVITKIDALDDEKRERVDQFSRYLASQEIKAMHISAVVGTGLNELKEVLFSAIGKLREVDQGKTINKFDPTINLY